MNDVLMDKIASLKTARKYLALAKEDLDRLNRKFDEENKSVILGVNQGKAEVLRIEKELRTMAVLEYKQTLSTHPADGVSIKLVDEVVYDYDEAVAWCRENLAAMLILDEKLFDDFVESRLNDDRSLPGLNCRLERVPTAVIARDL